MDYYNNNHFTALLILSGTTWVSWYQKSKTSLDLLEQEIMSGSGISWVICKSAPSCRQITMPAPHHSVFISRMPFLPPNQQHQSTEGTWMDYWWIFFHVLDVPPDTNHKTIHWTLSSLHNSYPEGKLHPLKGQHAGIPDQYVYYCISSSTSWHQTTDVNIFLKSTVTFQWKMSIVCLHIVWSSYLILSLGWAYLSHSALFDNHF